jgi:hypothetical protein
MDRLARNLDDLLKVVLAFTERGMHVREGEPDLYRRGLAAVASAVKCYGSFRTVRARPDPRAAARGNRSADVARRGPIPDGSPRLLARRRKSEVLSGCYAIR